MIRLTIEHPIGPRSFFQRARLIKDGVAIGEVYARHAGHGWNGGGSDYTFHPNEAGSALGLRIVGDTAQSGLLRELRRTLNLNAVGVKIIT